MRDKFEFWTIDLFLALNRDAKALGYEHDPEEYLDQCYGATLTQFPSRYILFNDAKLMILFKLKYSEYL